MKLKKLFILLASFALALGVHAAPGSDHSHDEKPEWAELFGGASLPVVWQSVTASAEKISAAVAAKKSDGVADWAETIHLASHALIDQVKLPDAERKKRLDAALEQAAKLADEVLDAANHNEIDKTADSFKRLQSALTLAKTRLPKEVTEAAPETPRFAKAPKHEGDHKH
jgi:hypothetical protein